MLPPTPAPAPRRLNVGVPRMAEVLRAIPGVHLLVTFATATEAVDWLAWERPNWHLAYVDMAMRNGSSEEVVRCLHAATRPGTVIGVCNHLWREEREKCAKLGVHSIIEKGDLIAFQDDVERRSR
jgi:DNA-binding NarL/FixJ family response regulator